jgi:peptidoglycan/LPS O-acetylase OafA/YrhL
MIITITNAVQATYVFIAILAIALIVSVRKRGDSELFPASVSQELKGFAILAVVFSHIGYFLMSDTRFLYPLTIMAGVGVNMFLFLSGYGLTVSAIKNALTPLQFYKKRLAKLFIPFWMTLTVFFLANIFILHLNYSPTYIIRSFLGYFPHANLYEDINSPLWYFSLILFFYLIFPLFFYRKRPWVSAIFVYLTGLAIIQWQPSFLNNIIHMYRVHLLAFPVGMLIANLFAKPEIFTTGKIGVLVEKIRKIKRMEIIKKIVYYFSFIALLYVFIYATINSNVGAGPRMEELTSIFTMLVLTILFLMKRWNIKLLYIVGICSFEIYLLHWPIMYHYDIFFKFLPAWLAMTAYLFLFVGLGWVLQKVSGAISKKVFE